MAKPASGKSNNKNTSPARNARRKEVRRNLSKDTFSWRSFLYQTETYTSIGLALIFITGITAVLIWVSNKSLIGEKQIMRETYVSRVAFQVFDKDKTDNNRELAIRKAPRVYTGSQAYLEKLEFNLRSLPAAVADKPTLNDIEPELVTTFSLTPQSLQALQVYVDDQGAVTNEWSSLIDTFMREGLYRKPVITSNRYQAELINETPAPIILKPVEGVEITTTVSAFIDVAGGETIEMKFAPLVGVFPEPLRPSIMSRLTKGLEPTYIFDEVATNLSREQAAAAIPNEYTNYEPGFVLYKKGEILTADQLKLVNEEYLQYVKNTDKLTLYASRMGTLGVVLLTTILLAGYLIRFHPKIIHKPLRVLVLVILMIVLFAITCTASSIVPGGILIFALIPTLLLSIITTVAYGQRFALVIGMLYPMLVCYALNLPMGYYILFVGCIGTNVYQLREIRDRDRLVYAGAITGVFAAVGVILLSLGYRPVVDGFMRATLLDALGGASSGLVVGIFTLGILSTVERIFNVTTGLTLVELRDPKQALLRELQQRAPGTYNHSIQVANLAEAATEAIGANSLLTYVGALYHDIGKMNKPSYFVENQADGENRHKKLSPAMSLLIIVGHVKDGIEMARDHGLPKPLHHFIEAHHGTTLVEYFYHAAKEKAQSGESLEQVEEVEYRYPGPKPRSREVAVTMLSDVVESASRAMSEPTPSRIEQLVRLMGEKRLIDGQFDDCDLTLRELRMVEDSLIKSLCAIHHVRINYPSEQQQQKREELSTAATKEDPSGIAAAAASTTTADKKSTNGNNPTINASNTTNKKHTA